MNPLNPVVNLQTTEHIHQAAIYESRTEFLQMVVPFVRAGFDAGEPTLVTLGHQRAEWLRTALGPAAAHANFLDGDAEYRRPSSTIETHLEHLTGLTRGHAGRIRVVGQVPTPAIENTWSWWARYEAAVNRLFADFPVSHLCTYDANVAGRDVLDDVRRTHPWLAATGARRRPSPTFEPPEEFFARHSPAADPLESATPLADVTDPSRSGARALAREAGRRSGCEWRKVMALEIAVNEAVTNAFEHGTPPVRLRVWWAPGRAVATVTDTGPGPDDPLVGLVRTSDSTTGGLGLWLAHESCDYVAIGTDEGFTVRLVISDTEPAD
ncbi:anti-sigma factor RsbA family regulatory protein [Pseudactinotalea sp. Z1739]|uniref:anti-sigma factor RsbA family regulatory protein n=1 Tax=Pseudactinotalea sp. Z1739 TaxID=3413028 RepID=UPI003C7E3949